MTIRTASRDRALGIPNLLKRTKCPLYRVGTIYYEHQQILVIASLRADPCLARIVSQSPLSLLKTIPSEYMSKPIDNETRIILLSSRGEACAFSFDSSNGTVNIISDPFSNEKLIEGLAPNKDLFNNNLPLADRFLRAQIRLRCQTDREAFLAIMNIMEEIEPKLLSLGENTLEQVPRANKFEAFSLFQNYLRMCANQLLKGAKIEHLIKLANAAALPYVLNEFQQQACGFGALEPVLPGEEFIAELPHGTFVGCLLSKILLCGGVLAPTTYFGANPAFYICPETRDTDLKEDNNTSQELRDKVAPFSLGEGIILNFDTTQLIARGSFTTYRFQPFDHSPKGLTAFSTRPPSQVPRDKNHLMNEVACFGLVSLNALSGRSKAEVIEKTGLPADLFRGIQWMDKSWHISS